MPDQQADIISSILPRSPLVGETLARFCRYLCAAAITMPATLRRRLAPLSQSTTPGFFPELERMQAEQLAIFVLRVFASRALRSVGLEYEARECELAQTKPLDAAYAAWRAEIDVECITSERRVEDFEAVAQIVAVNAAQAYWRVIGGSDAVVPLAGDHAALAVLAWEVPVATSRLADADLKWVWDCTAAGIDESMRSVFAPDAK